MSFVLELRRKRKTHFISTFILQYSSKVVVVVVFFFFFFLYWFKKKVVFLFFIFYFSLLELNNYNGLCVQFIIVSFYDKLIISKIL